METYTASAVNGHTMEYRVLGYDSEGYPILSQWDAMHSDLCRCTSADDLQDW